MKYFNIIPLVGGMTIANIKATNTLPTAIFSFTNFERNEKYLKKYFSDKNYDIPYYIIPAKKEEYDNFFKEFLDKNPKFFENTDFVSTVCPCSGLSMLNVSSGDYSRGSNAPQNEWIYKTIDIALNYIRPKVLWGENAPLLFNIKKENIGLKLNELAEKYGYRFLIIKTNTELHGIPQRRVRTFYFFFKDYIPLYNIPHSTNKQNLREFLSTISKDATFNDILCNGMKLNEYENFFKNLPFWKYFIEENGDKYSHILERIKDRKKIYSPLNEDIIIDEDTILNYREYVLNNIEKQENPDIKIQWKRVLKFLDRLIKKSNAGTGNFKIVGIFTIHHPMYSKDLIYPAVITKNLLLTHIYPENRLLTIREGAKLMGLPDDYDFGDKFKVEILHAISQNVPVNTAQDMTKFVIDYCENKLERLNSQFVLYDNIFNKLEEVKKRCRVLF